MGCRLYQNTWKEELMGKPNDLIMVIINFSM